MKIVFRSTDISPQRKLIEETDLTLASAIRIMETYESLQKLLTFLQRPRVLLYSMLSARSHRL